MSKIEWTGVTWNPWHGCTKISPGCKFCFMYRDKDRYGLDPKEVVRSKTKFDYPKKLKHHHLIFTCSWSDFFIEDADEWRKEAWDIIRDTPQHTYQILTKRPERIKECLPPEWTSEPELFDHVWIGVSIESNDYMYRVNQLVDGVVYPDRRKLFLSLEPLIGPVHLISNFHEPGTTANVAQYIDWVIVGGESGNETGKYRYRKADLNWFEHIIRDCKLLDKEFFIKQLGTHIAKRLRLKSRHGQDTNEFPKKILKNRNIPCNLPTKKQLEIDREYWFVKACQEWEKMRDVLVTERGLVYKNIHFEGKSFIRPSDIDEITQWFENAYNVEVLPEYQLKPRNRKQNEKRNEPIT